MIRIAIAALAATAANLLLRALGIALFDIPSGFEEIAVRAVVLSTVAAVIAAGSVYALVATTARDPARTYTMVAGVALRASLAPPLKLNAPAGAQASVAAFTRAARSAAPRPG